MIRGSQVVQRLIAMMPAQEAVTLHSRNAGESFTDVAYGNVRRRPPDESEMMLAGAALGQEVVVFEFYQTSEARRPKDKDKMTDAVAVVWHVKRVSHKQENTVHVATCLRALE